MARNLPQKKALTGWAHRKHLLAKMLLKLTGQRRKRSAVAHTADRGGQIEMIWKGWDVLRSPCRGKNAHPASTPE
jgi:hypothetical protein